jgi:multidrug efflux system outer membrane protein
MYGLPLAQFPDVVPPQIALSSTYPGADALANEHSVAPPLEQQIWSAGASVLQPVFTDGRLKSQLTRGSSLAYQWTIQQSFRDVSDGLIAYRKGREFREQEDQLLLSSADKAQRLTTLRYQAGATSYLEVLDSETRPFAAHLGLAQAQLSERLALVEVYRALGGDWNQ